MFRGLEKQQNKQVGRDKRVKTSPLFTPAVRRAALRCTEEVKLQLQVRARRGRGFSCTRNQVFQRATNHKRGF